MIDELAKRYRADLAAASLAPDDLEAEAQLTVPFSNFISEFARLRGLGDVRLFREARIDSIRPDFAASVAGAPCGWVELKAPDIGVDGASWKGRDRRRQ